jgi:hypothetical protein
VRARPMIDGWEPPGIEAVEAWETRRLARLPVPGLAGDLHHDMGRGSLAVRLVGSLTGDDARDTFLKNLRDKFHAGEPVDFIADIVAESALEQVVIVHFDLSERAGDPDGFRYDIVLREYVEPPEPPAVALGLDGLDDLDLGLDIDLGLDLLDLPGLLGSLPAIGPLLAPVKTAAAELGAALGQAGTLLDPLDGLLRD